MSSDDLFDDEEFDDAFLDELDAIQAKATASSVSQLAPTTTRPKPVESEDSFDDITFDFNDEELEQAELYVSQRNANRQVASSSKPTSHKQTTLFGDILPSIPLRKTKQWDHTEFAKTGIRKPKGKGRSSANNEDDNDDEEEVEFEQFPAPFPPPMKLQPDLLEAKHWIYPLNQPKRDYQYNIVKHCLWENTIVALPTGLGKTFVAGVVMLNFYRWFPEGKVVFVAPTKPLVAQQIEASHKTCGIPGSDAIELTGQNPKPMRARAWKEKRVFYMTPQTLINDLVSENCDVSKIILIVIDEAHRATGDYAYNQVIRFMMAKNPHFRVLALTATPGSNPEAVQNLIDGLHISRIEIRDENSLDLKQYIHEKKVEQHIIKMTEEFVVVRDLLVKLMEIHLKDVARAGIWHNNVNLVTMHPYAFQARQQTIQAHQRWASGSLSLLASLARVMGYLIEGTMKMCHKALLDLPDDKKAAEGKKETIRQKLRSEPAYQAVMKELERHNARGFPTHPKMDLLKSLILQHLTQRLPNDPDEGPAESTKVMVFATFRPCVEELVDFLNAESPIIRASRFIGQGTDKEGRRGLAQKVQLEVIQKFKNNEFNVLVATSIGEEGLDIGEVDLIICYDAQKTPIRMLQRLGRTGRKRAGVVDVLLSEGREEFNLDKAKDTYKHVQKTIWSGNQLELYADVERLLPDHIHPACLEKKMDIEEYVRPESGRKRSINDSTQPAKKRKRDTAIDRNIPAGASTDFVTASELRVKGKKPKKAKVIVPVEDLDIAGEDDDIDRELELGLSVPAPPPRRAKSDTTTKSKGKGKAALRKAKTDGGDNGRRTKKRKLIEPTMSQEMDDSDDLAIERGLTPPAPSHRTYPSPVLRSPKRLADDVIDLTDSDNEDDHRLGPWSSPKGISMSPQVKVSGDVDADMSWLIENDDDDDHVRFDILSSPGTKNVLQNSSAPTSSRARSHRRPSDPDISLVVISDSDVEMEVEVASPMRQISSPKNLTSPEAETSFPLTYPVRHLGVARKRRIVDLLPSEDSSPSSAGRFRRPQSPEVERRNKREIQPTRKIDGVWDDAAIHSGDETSEGSSGSDSERESDREFLQAPPETQVSPSYAQTQMYRQSLMTQAPNGGNGPQFAGPLQRRGRFGRGSIRMPARGGLVSSSPTRPDGVVDEYELDSFLVDDESEIVYEDE
ncbi:P-loop containing nucleoside triphosphate hydrolase protein [Hymenopellis radicata]|nr:P-loop containing nucleoside triphosphate hydrolase protein [Hymenopellis radicata]